MAVGNVLWNNGSVSMLWQIHLFGTLRAERGQETVTRFRSQKYGALLAYLALFPRRSHAREELADLLWPDADVEVARGNVRGALASLRRQFEPPGTPAGSVFVAEGRTHVRLNSDNVQVDVSEFEAALTLANHASSPEAMARHFAQAVQQYSGSLLPGLYENWCLSERDRLAEANLRALRELARLQEQFGDVDQALDYARRAVSADPLREEAHAEVIRLLMRTGQTGSAHRQFEEMTQLLRDHLAVAPSPQTEALLHAAAPRAVRSSPATVASPSHPVAVSKEVAPAPLASAVPQHLPPATTRFFGREDEITSLRQLLTGSGARLVTITGPGGSGKTRVAVEAARSLGADFGGGIWFVGLEAVRDADRFPDALASALALPKVMGQNTPMRERVTEALAERSAHAPVLLLLDNFEQIADDGAPLLAQLMESVPGLSCLVTSRQCLRIEPEQEFPLLPLPTPAHPGLPERLLEFSSVQLFVSRAQAAKADFQLSAYNAASVAALCTKLEGIPLAIELAAAWAAMLTPQQTLQRLENRLDFLVSRRRDITPRHRTLRAAIESSVALLPPEVSRFFYQLSVFRGGWNLEAAEAISDDPFALDYLTTLGEHSLIVSVSGADDTVVRFRMLETLREFASESLLAEGEDAVRTVQERHTRFFAALVDEALPRLAQADQAVWLRKLDTDHDNIRAVLERLDKADALEDALDLAAKMSGFWNARGYQSEGRERLTPLLKRAGDAVPAEARAKALSGLGKMAYLQGDYAVARASQDDCLALFRQEDNRDGIARTLCELGNCEMLRSNYAETAALLEESLTVYQELGDKRGAALVLNNLGAVSLAKGDPTAALPYLEACLPLSRELGHHRIVALALTNIASIWHDNGDLPRARQSYEQSLAIRRDLGDDAGVGHVLTGLGRVAADEGDGEAAVRYFDESLSLLRKTQRREAIAAALVYRGVTLVTLKNDLPVGIASLTESLTLSRDIGHKHFACYGLNAFATVAAMRQQWERAVALWGAANSQFEVLGVTLTPRTVQALADEIEAVRPHLPPDTFAQAWEAGRSMPLDMATTLALQVPDLTHLSPKLMTAPA